MRRFPSHQNTGFRRQFGLDTFRWPRSVNDLDFDIQGRFAELVFEEKRVGTGVAGFGAGYGQCGHAEYGFGSGATGVWQGTWRIQC